MEGVWSDEAIAIFASLNLCLGWCVMIQCWFMLFLCDLPGGSCGYVRQLAPVYAATGGCEA